MGSAQKRATAAQRAFGVQFRSGSAGLAEWSSTLLGSARVRTPGPRFRHESRPAFKVGKPEVDRGKFAVELAAAGVIDWAASKPTATEPTEPTATEPSTQATHVLNVGQTRLYVGQTRLYVGQTCLYFRQTCLYFRQTCLYFGHTCLYVGRTE